MCEARRDYWKTMAANNGFQIQSQVPHHNHLLALRRGNLSFCLRKNATKELIYLLVEGFGHSLLHGGSKQ